MPGAWLKWFQLLVDHFSPQPCQGWPASQFILIKGTKMAIFILYDQKWFSLPFGHKYYFLININYFQYFGNTCSLKQSWIINILINKKEIISRDSSKMFWLYYFMEIKACKGRIYLHRNLIKIFDQRYC